MKKRLCALVSVLASTGVFAQTSYENADVLQTTPIYRMIETEEPVQSCWEEEVVRGQSRHHYRSNTPGLLGAVIGGAIGNAAGNHKSSQRVGAVVGAVLGHSIARDLTYSDRRPSATYIDTVERCETVYDYHQEEKLVGYDVLYSYNDREYTVRMPRDPGPSVRVRVDVEPVF